MRAVLENALLPGALERDRARAALSSTGWPVFDIPLCCLMQFARASPEFVFVVGPNQRRNIGVPANDFLRDQPRVRSSFSGSGAPRGAVLIVTRPDWIS